MSRSSVNVTNPSHQGSLPLQLAALIGQSVTLFALTSPIVTIGYPIFVFLLSIVGLLTVRTIRYQGTAESRLLPGAAILIVTFITVQFIVTRFGRALPLEFVLTSADMSIMMALTFTSSLATFYWLTDTATLFSCVWSIAMAGLAATLNLSVSTIICFAIYLLCTLFLLVHHHTLVQAGPQGRPLVLRGPLLLLQMRTAGLLFLLTFVLGVLVAIPLQMLGRNMSLANVLERLKVSPEAKRDKANKQLLTFDNPQEFVVGLGPVTDDDTLHYQVQSPRASYWRIRSFATCLGNQWSPFDSGLQTDLDGKTLSPSRDAGGTHIFDISAAMEGERTKTEKVDVSVEPVGGARALCHLAEPRQFRSLIPQIVRRVDGTLGQIRSAMDMGMQATPYALTCEVSTAAPEDLNRAPKTYPQEIIDRYLQEPNPGLLDELARQAIGTKTLPFDRAEAIRQFIANRCVYSLDAKPCPPGRNPAEWFLNESKVGYCDLYATAMTLLCRAAGIPARIATGFNAGEIDPDHTNAYKLRERNRHAWCEVFFTGYGWIPFDATVLTAAATTAPVASAPRQKTRASSLPMGPLALAGLAVLGLVAVGTTELLRRRGILPSRAGISHEQLFAQRVQAYYKTALHQLKRQGVGRESSMTIGEHHALVRERLGSAIGLAYERLARQSERALFSQQAIRETDVTLAQEALRELGAALKERKQDGANTRKT